MPRESEWTEVQAAGGGQEGGRSEVGGVRWEG